ncbi:hypothetical protein JTB14_037159, partial [Gonioctena quinquepunctata]
GEQRLSSVNRKSADEKKMAYHKKVSYVENLSHLKRKGETVHRNPSTSVFHKIVNSEKLKTSGSPITYTRAKSFADSLEKLPQKKKWWELGKSSKSAQKMPESIIKVNELRRSTIASISGDEDDDDDDLESAR